MVMTDKCPGARLQPGWSQEKLNWNLEKIQWTGAPALQRLQGSCLTPEAFSCSKLGLQGPLFHYILASDRGVPFP